MPEQKTKKTRRAKGEGSVFKNTTKGGWTARYQGKEFSGKTQREAVSKLNAYKLLVINGEAVSSKLRVDEYGKKFLYFKAQQVKRKTIKETTYDRLERTFENQILKYPISTQLMVNLTSDVLQKYIDTLSKEYSLSTIKKAHQFFSAMISYGKKHHDFPSSYDPLAGVELPNEKPLKVQTKKIEIIPDKYLPIIKKVALSRRKSGALSYRYGPLLVFCLNPGLREGELLSLSKAGIQTRHGRQVYRVSETSSIVKNREKNPDTKTKRIFTDPKYPRSKRSVPLNKEAVDCLQIMMESYEPNKDREDLIVNTKKGKVPTARSIQLAFDNVLKEGNLPHYGVHALRHTFATQLLKKTKSHQDIKAVAEILGDDYQVVIDTYLHTEDDGKHGLVDMLAAQ